MNRTNKAYTTRNKRVELTGAALQDIQRAIESAFSQP